MGSPHRRPWQERDPHTAESSPSLLALHAALRDPGLATVLCPEARLELSGFQDLSQPSLEFSLSPNLHSLGSSLGLTWEPGMKAQGHPPWAAASKDDKYPLTQGIPRLSSPS